SQQVVPDKMELVLGELFEHVEERRLEPGHAGHLRGDRLAGEVARELDLQAQKLRTALEQAPGPPLLVFLGVVESLVGPDEEGASGVDVLRSAIVVQLRANLLDQGAEP